MWRAGRASKGKEQGSLKNIRPQHGDTGRDGMDAGTTSIEGNFKLSIKTKLTEAHPGVLRNIFPLMPNDGCARTPFAMANRVRSTLLLPSPRDPRLAGQVESGFPFPGSEGKSIPGRAEPRPKAQEVAQAGPLLGAEHRAPGTSAQGDGPGSQSAQSSPQSPLSINQHPREGKNCPKG